MSDVSALRVADEAFFVASTIERCPKTMMLRELVVNAVEAADHAQGEKLVDITLRRVDGVPKLSIWNTGKGLSAIELYQICDLASSLGKKNSLDDNFGMGAKVASLPSNKHGLRYRSCLNGTVSEVILCQRQGVYGRLRQRIPDGTMAEVVNATEACQSEGGYDLSRDWTEVVLFGNRPEQNTLHDPYDGNPPMAVGWLVEALLLRFFDLPKSVEIRLAPDVSGQKAWQTLRSIAEAGRTQTKEEVIATPSGLRIHYQYNPGNGTPNTSGSISNSIAAVVYRGEVYDLMQGPRWVLDSPTYGIPFGAKFISVYVELPTDYPVRPEAYRQFLRFRGSDQRQVFLREFSRLVRAHIPEWLARIIHSLGPDQASYAAEMHNELGELLKQLGVAPSAQMPMAGPRANAGPKVATPSGAPPKPPAPPQAKFERPPEIIELEDPELIAERGLDGRVAKFYEASHQMFINLCYPSIPSFADQLCALYRDTVPPEQCNPLALQVARWSVTRSVARALIYSLSKKTAGWSAEEVRRAQSPESLSVIADDWALMLQAARTRMDNLLGSEASVAHSEAA
jgi:hypothetical protein